MQIDYDVGDCVVYVGTEGVPYPKSGIIVGSLHRVKWIGLDGDDGFVWTEVEGRNDLITSTSFRKLPKASDEFTEQMRKLKPHKQKVEARCHITGQPLSVREMFESECG